MSTPLICLCEPFSPHPVARPYKGLEEMEFLLHQCSKSKVVIPSIGVLEAAIKDAKEWSIYTKELFVSGSVSILRIV